MFVKIYFNFCCKNLYEAQARNKWINKTKQNKKTLVISLNGQLFISITDLILFATFLYLNFNLFVNIDKTNQYHLNNCAMKMYED